jgi:hypothetical protein
MWKTGQTNQEQRSANVGLSEVAESYKGISDDDPFWLRLRCIDTGRCPVHVGYSRRASLGFWATSAGRRPSIDVGR